MMDRAEQSNGNELRHAAAVAAFAEASGGRVHHRGRVCQAPAIYIHFFFIIIIHFHFDSRPRDVQHGTACVRTPSDEREKAP